MSFYYCQNYFHFQNPALVEKQCRPKGRIWVSQRFPVKPVLLEEPSLTERGRSALVRLSGISVPALVLTIQRAWSQGASQGCALLLISGILHKHGAGDSKVKLDDGQCYYLKQSPYTKGAASQEQTAKMHEHAGQGSH